MKTKKNTKLLMSIVNTSACAAACACDKKSISRNEFDQLIKHGHSVVLFDKNNKTYILDLDGFKHPGPPLIEKGIVKPGDNVTELFNSKEFHNDKNPLEKICILGILES